MTKIKIAIQGELGAYSHIAAENLYSGAEIKTCATFEETFRKAFDDSNYKIVIPIENSLAGRVADIHYLLPKYKLQIHGEHFQTVEHNLLCKPDANMEDIKFVRSHAQAIGQCQNLINKRKFTLISIFLFLYVALNLLDGERGLISYYEKQKIIEQLFQKEKSLTLQLDLVEKKKRPKKH